jgi:hypothetical protein
MGKFLFVSGSDHPLFTKPIKPFWWGYNEVIMLPRLGLHCGAVQKLLANLTPSSASLSIFGVCKELGI